MDRAMAIPSLSRCINTHPSPVPFCSLFFIYRLFSTVTSYPPGRLGPPASIPRYPVSNLVHVADVSSRR